MVKSYYWSCDLIECDKAVDWLCAQQYVITLGPRPRHIPIVNSEPCHAAPNRGRVARLVDSHLPKEM